MGQQRIEEMPDFSPDSPMGQALLNAPFDPSVPAHENPATRAAIEALADQYFSGGGQMSQAATTAQRSFMPPYNAFAGVARRKTG